jgi:Family of unknown function (DUF6545)
VNRRRARRAAAEIDIPVPFRLGEFTARLGRRTRPLHMVPVAAGAHGVSGAWFRTAAADFLCYEPSTSAFHQAHIVAHLAAYLLLSSGGGAAIDRRLTPDLGAAALEHVAGPAARDPVTGVEADLFAALVLRRARLLAGPRVGARRRLRELEPLWDGLRGAVPEAASTSRGRRRSAKLRLYRRVIEIRDAQLALRPYLDRAAAEAGMTAARSAGLEGDDREAAVEAALLAAAAQARKAGRRARQNSGDPGWPAVRGGPDLAGDAAWLARVSRAFTGLPEAGDPARGAPLAPARNRGNRPAGWERLRSR